jgi:hypothetical protein
MKETGPVDEERYEVNVDIHGIRDGPRLGRQRALNKVRDIHICHVIINYWFSLSHGFEDEEIVIVMCLLFAARIFLGFNDHASFS